MSSSEAPHAGTAYQTLCTSYTAIDGFRGTLLGFLPLATGGIFLLAGGTGKGILCDPKLSVPLGLFGFFITLGLFIYEIYGIRRCTHLIILGQHLEKQLKIEGQFLHRPQGLGRFVPAGFGPLISEPMASGVIYPAVGAAWLYLGVHCVSQCLAAVLAMVIFVLGFGITYRYNKWLVEKEWPEQEGNFARPREGNGSIEARR